MKTYPDYLTIDTDAKADGIKDKIKQLVVNEEVAAFKFDTCNNAKATSKGNPEDPLKDKISELEALDDTPLSSRFLLYSCLIMNFLNAS